MKIHFKRGDSPRQFGVIKITCSDAKMAEMLAVRTKYPEHTRVSLLGQFSDYRSGKDSCFEFCLTSGAKLKITKPGRGFYIYSYSQNGKDALAAVEELKLLEALRAARIQLIRMYSAMGSSRDPTRLILREYLNS
jgi:hypothetical protein